MTNRMNKILVKFLVCNRGSYPFVIEFRPFQNAYKDKQIDAYKRLNLLAADL